MKPAARPPYRIASMAEIAALPPNGYSVVSTFSGCGGSCLGFRMAGFTVLWASEFIEAARRSYAANAPTTPLDARDIREVTAADILAATGLARGELDVLEGSPPCASFSTAGKRSAGWGKVRSYSDTAQRTDDLFMEYARLLEGLQPRVFVAENVAGLTRGVAVGYFREILAALRAAGYTVGARVLDAQWLGVPQTRQRLIFVGVRNDLGVAPAFPRPLPYRYTLADAVPWLAKARIVRSNGREKGQAVGSPDQPLPCVLADAESIGGAFGGARVHIEGGPPSPTAAELEAANMERYAVGAEWRKLRPGQQSAKYFNAQRAHPDRPCPTVTATGAHTTAASPMHPHECRKFVTGELLRISSFPDDFRLEGTFAERWERVGRAVPPVMMAAVATVVRDEILARLATDERRTA
jgi:DNA (cytosine-5)-methyltransferase 1